MSVPRSHPLPSEHPTSPQTPEKEDQWVEPTHHGAPDQMTRPDDQTLVTHSCRASVGLSRTARRRHRHGRAWTPWGEAPWMKALGRKNGRSGAVLGPCSSGQPSGAVPMLPAWAMHKQSEISPARPPGRDGPRLRPGRWGHPCDSSVAGRVGGPKRTPHRWVHLRALSHDLPCPQRSYWHPRPCSQLLVEEAHGRVAAPHQLLGTTEKLLNGIGPQGQAVRGKPLKGPLGAGGWS